MTERIVTELRENGPTKSISEIFMFYGASFTEAAIRHGQLSREMQDTLYYAFEAFRNRLITKETLNEFCDLIREKPYLVTVAATAAMSVVIDAFVTPQPQNEDKEAK